LADDDVTSVLECSREALRELRHVSPPSPRGFIDPRIVHAENTARIEVVHAEPLPRCIAAVISRPILIHVSDHRNRIGKIWVISPRSEDQETLSFEPLSSRSAVHDQPRHPLRGADISLQARSRGKRTDDYFAFFAVRFFATFAVFNAIAALMSALNAVALIFSP
jgi:hypothetical protein